MSQVHQDNQIAECLNTQLSFILFTDVCMCVNIFQIKCDYCMQIQLVLCKIQIIEKKE
jgi:hypothetical protein